MFAHEGNELGRLDDLRVLAKSEEAVAKRGVVANVELDDGGPGPALHNVTPQFVLQVLEVIFGDLHARDEERIVTPVVRVEPHLVDGLELDRDRVRAVRSRVLDGGFVRVGGFDPVDAELTQRVGAVFASDHVPLGLPPTDGIRVEHPALFVVAEAHRGAGANRAAELFDPSGNGEHDALFVFVDGRAELPEHRLVVHSGDVDRGGCRDQGQALVGGEERRSQPIDVLPVLIVDADAEPGLEIVEIALQPFAHGLPSRGSRRQLALDLVAGHVPGDVGEGAAVALLLEKGREPEDAFGQIRAHKILPAAPARDGPSVLQRAVGRHPRTTPM